MSRTPYTCPDCGATLLGQYLEKHRKSVGHRRGAELRSLFDSGARFSHIAREFGLSRERVGQLARRMGVGTGRERSRIQKMEKRLRQNHFWPYRKELSRHATLNFHVTPQSDRLLPVALCWLNGILCTIRPAWHRPSLPRYTALGACSERLPAEMVLFRLGHDRWLIVPASRLRRATSVLLLEEHKSKGSHRNDWKSFIDAWHLLNGK
jgi:hypothetical protein